MCENDIGQEGEDVLKQAAIDKVELVLDQDEHDSWEIMISHCHG